MNWPLHIQPAKILTAHVFVDGAYLQERGKAINVPYPNPSDPVDYILRAIRDMGGNSPTTNSVLRRRTSFYHADAEPGAPHAPTPEMEAYWAFVEQLPDTDLRFGEVRGRRARQKGVDVLLAVDMLVGAVDRVFDVAILVAGDADFIPVINEVRRRGVSVVVGGVTDSIAPELRDAADRFIALDAEGSWALNRDPFVPPARAS